MQIHSPKARLEFEQVVGANPGCCCMLCQGLCDCSRFCVCGNLLDAASVLV